MGTSTSSKNYDYIGVMISYLERILQIISSFLSNLGKPTTTPSTTEAPTTAAVETPVED